MYLFVSGALVPTKQHFTTIGKMQDHCFSRFFHLAGTSALLLRGSWVLLAASGSSLGAHGNFWRLLLVIHESHRFITQNVDLPFPKPILNVSHEL